MAAPVYKTCFLCNRVGQRGFHQVQFGKHKGAWRCNASIACDKRVYKQVVIKNGWWKW